MNFVIISIDIILYKTRNYSYTRWACVNGHVYMKELLDHYCKCFSLIERSRPSNLKLSLLYNFSSFRVTARIYIESIKVGLDQYV